MASHHALDFAKWFIKHGHDNPSNKFDGNMKLQKLLFFAQLIHLARGKGELFSDPIFAFEHGSVVEPIRLEYRNNYGNLLEQAQVFDESGFSIDENETLQLTIKIFGNVPAKQLSDINHFCSSWQESYERSGKKGGYKSKGLSVIPISSLKRAEVPKMMEVLSAYKPEETTDREFEIINGITFYYDPDEIRMDDDLIRQLESFEGDDLAYTICKDNTNKIIIY